MHKAALLAFAISLQPLVSEDVLEPSIRNEVDHALSMAPESAFAPSPDAKPQDAGKGGEADAKRADAAKDGGHVHDVFSTNGLSATEIAIRLVSMQRSDGRWFCGTNDVTAAAVAILQSL